MKVSGTTVSPIKLLRLFASMQKNQQIKGAYILRQMIRGGSFTEAVSLAALDENISLPFGFGWIPNIIKELGPEACLQIIDLAAAGKVTFNQAGEYFCGLHAMIPIAKKLGAEPVVDLLCAFSPATARFVEYFLLGLVKCESLGNGQLREIGHPRLDAVNDFAVLKSLCCQVDPWVQAIETVKPETRKGEFIINLVKLIETHGLENLHYLTRIGKALGFRDCLDQSLVISALGGLNMLLHLLADSIKTMGFETLTRVLEKAKNIREGEYLRGLLTIARHQTQKQLLDRADYILGLARALEAAKAHAQLWPEPACLFESPEGERLYQRFGKEKLINLYRKYGISAGGMLVELFVRAKPQTDAEFDGLEKKFGETREKAKKMSGRSLFYNMVLVGKEFITKIGDFERICDLWLKGHELIYLYNFRVDSLDDLEKLADRYRAQELINVEGRYLLDKLKTQRKLEIDDIDRARLIGKTGLDVRDQEKLLLSRLSMEQLESIVELSRSRLFWHWQSTAYIFDHLLSAEALGPNRFKLALLLAEQRIYPIGALIADLAKQADMLSRRKEYKSTADEIISGRYDPKNELHQMIGFTLYLDKLRDAGITKADCFNYAYYLSIINAGKLEEVSQAHREIDTREKLQAHALFAGWEICKLLDQIQTAAANPDGRPILVIGNETYGAELVKMIGPELDALGVKRYFTKVGSSQCHNNPYYFIPKLLDQDTLDFIRQKRPHIIIVDATKHMVVRDEGGHIKHARYPDSHQGWFAYFTALNILLAGKQGTSAFQKMKGDEYVAELLKKPEVIAFIQAAQKQVSEPYQFEFNNPAGIDLVAREERREIGSIASFNTKDLESKATIIFANAVMPPEFMPSELRNLYPGIMPVPGVFDDTYAIKRILFRVTPYGVVVKERALQRILRRGFEQARTIEINNQAPSVLRPVPTPVRAMGYYWR